MSFEMHIKIEGQVFPLKNGKFSYSTQFRVNDNVISESVIESQREFLTWQDAQENLKLWAGFLSEMLKGQIKEKHNERTKNLKFIRPQQ